MRLSEYRAMWVLVFYDLPTDTKADRRQFALFRKFLQKNGFTMFQFSFYIRHCASVEGSDVHIRKVECNLPPRGQIGILRITDKQLAISNFILMVQGLTYPILRNN